MFIKTEPKRLSVVKFAFNRYKRFSNQIRCFNEIRGIFSDYEVHILYDYNPKVLVSSLKNKSDEVIKAIQAVDKKIKKAGFSRAGDWKFSYGSFDCEYHRNHPNKRHDTVSFFLYSENGCEIEEVEVTETKNMPVGLCAKALESINLKET